MVVKKVTLMNPGDGVTSYANNSTLQKVVIIEALPVLDETLKEMLGDHHGFFCRPLKMVDLGCSSGPNPIFIISHILHTLQTMQFPPPDHLIEVFLNDLPDNDFNNLFKLVSTAYRKQLIPKQCFVYGLPGSFYGKLFPTNSLHFAYSFYSLHWLSQIPEGLEKMNKENIYIARTSPPEVWEAYAMQYERDLSRFLALRGDEIVVGGGMVLTFVGRSVEDPTSCQDDAAYLTLLSQTLADMVAEGVVKMEDLYSFNVPIYLPCCGEVERVIHDEGSFSLQKMQAFRLCSYARMLDDSTDGDEGKMVADSVRAFMEPMLGIHFGFSTFDADQVFARYAQRVAMYLSLDNDGSYFTSL